MRILKEQVRSSAAFPCWEFYGFPSAGKPPFSPAPQLFSTSFCVPPPIVNSHKLLKKSSTKMPNICKMDFQISVKWSYLYCYLWDGSFPPFLSFFFFWKNALFILFSLMRERFVMIISYMCNSPSRFHSPKEGNMYVGLGFQSTRKIPDKCRTNNVDSEAKRIYNLAEKGVQAHSGTTHTHISTAGIN